MDFSDLDQIPRPIGVSGFNFPSRLKKKKVRGRIVLLLKLNAEGEVTDVQIDRSDLPMRVGLGQFQEISDNQLRFIKQCGCDDFQMNTPKLPGTERWEYEDIARLVEGYLDYFRVQTKKPITTVDARAMDVMMRYDWPGNVRELVNAMERAFLFADSKGIRVEDLPVRIVASVRDEAQSKRDMSPRLRT